MSMTTNQPSVVDEGAFTVRRTISIAAPIEKVWSAVTEPAHISRWFGHRGVRRIGAPARSARSPGRAATRSRCGSRRSTSRAWSPTAGPTTTRAGSSPDAIDDEHSTVFTFTLEPAPGRHAAHRRRDRVRDHLRPAREPRRPPRGMGRRARQARRPARGRLVTTATLVPVFAALGDETRWSILAALGEGDASASALAGRLPVTRQAIAKHLAVLQDVGLVEPVRVGREVRYRVIGAQLSATARRLDAIGAEWDRRLAAIKEIAEGL